MDREIEIAPGVFFPAWTYNGTIPGPVIRATEGDTLRVRFRNHGVHPHTIHFHGIHPANQDGVFQIVEPQGSLTYEFEARPAGFHLYHCHATPLKKHIHKGLYGAFIIDPAKPRPPARELVMVMNGYDTDADGENNFYTVNGRSFYYARYPIRVRRSELVRIYLANLTEFDLINSFHLHGDFFQYQPTGTGDNWEYTDTVMQCQGQRGVIEIQFANTGHFMFHAHQSEFAELGWMGVLRGRRLVSEGNRTPRPRCGRAESRATGAALAGLLRDVGSGGAGRRAGALLVAVAWSSRAARRSSTSSGRTRRRRTSSTSAASSSSPERSGSRSGTRSATTSRSRTSTSTTRSCRSRSTGPRRSAGFARARSSSRTTGSTTIRSRSASRARPGSRPCEEIPAAIETPTPSAEGFLGYALIGVLVGILPVALGLLWLPALRQASRGLALRVHGSHRRAAHLPRRRGAVGGVRAAGALPSALGGSGLVLLGVALSFLG